MVVNRVLKSVEANYGEESKYDTSLEYSILDMDGRVIYKNSENATVDLNTAIKNRDTILDITVDGAVVGRVVILNNTIDRIKAPLMIEITNIMM